MKAWMEKLKGFWARRGFFVLAALCLLLIAGAAVYARARLFAPPPAAQLREAAKEASGDALTAAPAAPTAVPELAQPSALSWPVSGREILRGYAPEPVWYEPLGLYETHPGVDIRAEAGEKVLAAADGTVSAAEYDARLGYMVEIRDEEGLVIRYGNLAKGAAVKAGERVRGGREIGAVGASAPGEGARGPCLHFEAFRGGVWVALP